MIFSHYKEYNCFHITFFTKLILSRLINLIFPERIKQNLFYDEKIIKAFSMGITKFLKKKQKQKEQKQKQNN